MANKLTILFRPWLGQLCGIFFLAIFANNYTHVLLAAENNVDLAPDREPTITDTAIAPSATTEAATELGSTNATLNATVNPNGADTLVYFKYGSTTNYGKVSATNVLLAGVDDVSVEQIITGLGSGSNYHYCVFAANSEGTNTGSNLTFSTLSGPIPISLSATNIGTSNATLRATINPGGAPTDYYFRYGTTINFGFVTPTNTLPATNAVLSVSNVLSGLSPGTTYIYRIYAVNSLATNNGSSRTFTTVALAPVLATLPASDIGVGVATLNAVVNPGGAATKVHFQYGLTTNYDSHTAVNTLAGGAVAISVSNTINGLLPSMTYNFRVVAGNSGGTNTGTNLTFMTSPPTAPILSNNTATSTGLKSVTMNGTVNPNGLPTAAWFEWGGTTNYGTITSATNLTSGTTNRSFSAVVTNLSNIEIYYYRAMASNSLGLVYGAPQSMVAPSFLNVTASIAPGMPGFGSAIAGWVDYNNDGLLDFFHTGNQGGDVYLFQLWRNTGSGFTNVTSSVAPNLSGISFTSVEWSDYDNDGLLDILTGKNNGSSYFISKRVQIWRNTDSGFTDVTASVAPDLPAVESGAVAWGDYDNDQRIDLLFTGLIGPTYGNNISQIWRNTSNGFINVTDSIAPGLPGVHGASLTWSDYDNDGRLDILLSGSPTANAHLSQLWRNTGNGFTNVTAAVVPGLPSGFGPVTWGDYDDDGRLDFFLMGSSTGSSCQIWQNTGSGFTNVTTSVAPGLPGANGVSMAWGNYDNDGHIDFLLIGSQNNFSSPLWRNTGSGFTNVPASVTTDLKQSGSVACGDYDNDGRLDFILTGRGSSSGLPGTQLWRNYTQRTNAPPDVTTLRPSGDSATNFNLKAQIHPHGFEVAGWFIWGSGTNYDQVTSAQNIGAGQMNLSFTQSITGLTPGIMYHVRAVASNALGEIRFGREQLFFIDTPTVMTSSADAIIPDRVTLNGIVNPNSLGAFIWFEWGLTPDFGQSTEAQWLGGNAAINNPFGSTLTNLSGGVTFYYRAVASNSLGLVYGSMQSLTTPVFADLTASAAPGLPGIAYGSMAWGDYDNDGWLDFLITGIANPYTGEGISQMWRNTGNGFVNVTASIVPWLSNVAFGSVTWVDYDNDGHLDFLITGFFQDPYYSNWDIIAQLWRNTGSGFDNVTASVVPGLPGVFDSSVAWGDYDNDGRLDFLIVGSGSNSPVSQLWRNTSSGFTNVTATVVPGLSGVNNPSVAWGDYDNDGRLDFLITGSGSNSPVSQLWRNTDNDFTNVTATVAPDLPQFHDSSVAWGDYDNDGLLDFLMTGGNTNSFKSLLWRNTGNGFTNMTASIAPGLPKVENSLAAWGDYNNDGLLDFLLTGNDHKLGYLSQLWRNTGSGFTNVTAIDASSLSGVYASVIAWGDFDNDGRLDYLLTGSGNNDELVSQLWRNYTLLTNSPPSAPTGLAMTATTNAVMLSWNSATDSQTPALGLTYNVRAGTSPGGTNLLAAHVNATNGFRRVPAMGNAMLRHTLPLTGLTNGQTVYWSVQAVDSAFAGGPFAVESSDVSIPELINITAHNATNAILSWIPPTWGWTLQKSIDLNFSEWITVTADEAYAVIDTTTNAVKFYRLVNPE